MDKNMEKLIESIGEIMEVTEGFDALRHIFSKDDAVKNIAKLRRSAGSILHRIKLSGIKSVKHPTGECLKERSNTGQFVSVRPCGDEYEGKTFLGVFVGDVVTGSSVSIEDDSIVCQWKGNNPAILIPDLGKIVYGYNSWWSEIESESDLKTITDLDISNVWYVKALKQTNKNQLES